MDQTRRRVLDALARGPVSGPRLADELGVSRAAIWKQIEALRQAGFQIESADEGYVVQRVPEYGESAVAFGLELPYEIEYFDTCPSTNDEARVLARSGSAETIVLGNEQSAGRGRLGRKWVGPPGGIYLSILTRPQLAPMEVPLLTLAAAVATVQAVANVGITATIKWPNDVLYRGRKLAGVLTEMEGEADRVNWAIIGIGVNANVGEAELPAGATSLEAIRGNPIVRREVVQELLRRFHSYREEPTRILPAWREHAGTIDQAVSVETSGETVVGTAVDVTDTGSLVVETDHGRVRVHAGDCEHLRAGQG